MNDAPGRLVGRLALLWAGLTVAVAFIATPAKFAALLVVGFAPAARRGAVG